TSPPASSLSPLNLTLWSPLPLCLSPPSLRPPFSGSQERMTDPVVAADGFTYERRRIADWLSSQSTSPLTGEHMPHSLLTPNYLLARMLNNF
ncbi:unnamed protein product, partial [Closterium sp. NIES-64]